MELPKYHETFMPILETLSNGESISSRELATRVRDKYYSDLPKELLDKKTSTGANTLIDRILWGKSYLKMGKFVFYPKRGMVQIGEKGKHALEIGQMLLSDLQNDPDFIQHRAYAKSKWLRRPAFCPTSRRQGGRYRLDLFFKKLGTRPD